MRYSSQQRLSVSTKVCGPQFPRSNSFSCKTTRKLSFMTWTDYRITAPQYFFVFKVYITTVLILQLAELSSVCKLELRHFPFDDYPEHVRQLKSFAWKILVIAVSMRCFIFLLQFEFSNSQDYSYFFRLGCIPGVRYDCILRHVDLLFGKRFS